MFDNARDAAAEINKRFRDNADAAQAAGMKAYMRNRFDFYGIPAPRRKELVKDVLARAPLSWEFVQLMWDLPFRECQYTGADHLRRHRFNAEDLPNLQRFIVTRSWWDTADSLAKCVGTTLRGGSGRDGLIEWAHDQNIWVRRCSIIAQLGRGSETDADLLTYVIEANSAQRSEFFIAKAIGWALRDYSKSDPEWVAKFLATHDLAPLSVREASKYL